MKPGAEINREGVKSPEVGVTLDSVSEVFMCGQALDYTVSRFPSLHRQNDILFGNLNSAVASLPDLLPEFEQDGSIRLEVEQFLGREIPEIDIIMEVPLSEPSSEAMKFILEQYANDEDTKGLEAGAALQLAHEIAATLELSRRTAGK